MGVMKMEVERVLKLKMEMSERDANNILYGLSMGINHITDHIHPDNPLKQELLLRELREIEKKIYKAMKVK